VKGERGSKKMSEVNEMGARFLRDVEIE